jgi:hypothetical protein
MPEIVALPVRSEDDRPRRRAALEAIASMGRSAAPARSRAGGGSGALVIEAEGQDAGATAIATALTDAAARLAPYAGGGAELVAEFETEAVTADGTRSHTRASIRFRR